MATIYIDPTWTGTNSGTFAQPYNDWWTDIRLGVGFIAGNTYLQKAGTVWSGAGTQLQINVTGTETAPIIIGSYDPDTGVRTTGGVDRAIIDGTGQTQSIRTSGGINWVFIDNFEVYETDGLSGTRGVGIFLGSSAASPSNNCKITNCYVHDIKDTLFPVADNNGIQVFGSNTMISNNTVERIPTDGIWIQGNNNSILWNRLVNVSTATGASNGDCIQVNGDATLGANNNLIAFNYCDHSSKPTKQVIIVGGTGFANNNTVVGNTCLMAAYDNVVQTTCIFSETAGFTAVSNKCYGGYRGFFLGANNNTVVGNEVKSNEYGLVSVGVGTNVYGNTFVGSTLYGVHINTDTTANAKNNLFFDCTTAIAMEDGSGSNFNAYWQCGTNEALLGGANNYGATKFTADPGIDGAYKPAASSILYHAGTHLGYSKDADGKQFNNPPTIGAYEVMAARATRV